MAFLPGGELQNVGYIHNLSHTTQNVHEKAKNTNIRNVIIFSFRHGVAAYGGVSSDVGIRMIGTMSVVGKKK